MPLPDPRRSAAILIGTDVYDQPELADLPAVANNLQGLRSALTDTAAGGFLIDNCLQILNPSSTRLISERLLQVAEKAQDTLLVYIAGHGLPDMSSGELYLALRDTNIENLRFTALRYDDLRQLFLHSTRLAAAKRIVILDCCYSGRALPTMSEDQLGGMVDIDGVYIMTSTSENVRALAPLGERYTAFTGQFLNILNEGVPGGPELLTLDSIYHRLDSIMLARGLPRPQKVSRSQIGRLALRRNRAYVDEDLVAAIADSRPTELTYAVDIVFVIDATASMRGVLDWVKNRSVSFNQDLRSMHRAVGKLFDRLRVRVIVYRDFLADAAGEALMSTEFLTLQYNRSVTLPDEIERFDAFMQAIEATGGGPGDRESGLEALAAAIRSPWVIGATKRRQIIVVWTDGGTHDLDGGVWKPPGYPADMPRSFDELTDMWDGDQYMDRNAKRLILFAPDIYAWTDIANNWENTLHYVARAGEGLRDNDYRMILDAIANSV
jgi:hypothetical protein